MTVEKAQQAWIRTHGRIAIGKGRTVSRGHFNPRTVGGGCINGFARQQINPAGRGLVNNARQQHIVAEAIIPIPQTLAAISIFRIAVKERPGLFQGGAHKKGALLGRFKLGQRGARHPGETDRHPIIFAVEPMPGLFAAQHVAEWFKDSPLQFAAQQRSHFWIKLVAEQPIGRRQIPPECRRKEIYGDHGSIVVAQLAIIVGKYPGALGTQRTNRMFKLGNKPAAIFGTLGQRESRHPIPPRLAMLIPFGAGCRRILAMQFHVNFVSVFSQGLFEQFFSRHHRCPTLSAAGKGVPSRAVGYRNTKRNRRGLE